MKSFLLIFLISTNCFAMGSDEQLDDIAQGIDSLFFAGRREANKKQQDYYNAAVRAEQLSQKSDYTRAMEELQMQQLSEQRRELMELMKQRLQHLQRSR